MKVETRTQEATALASRLEDEIRARKVKRRDLEKAEDFLDDVKAPSPERERLAKLWIVALVERGFEKVEKSDGQYLGKDKLKSAKHKYEYFLERGLLDGELFNNLVGNGRLEEVEAKFSEKPPFGRSGAILMGATPAIIVIGIVLMLAMSCTGPSGGSSSGFPDGYNPTWSNNPSDEVFMTHITGR